MERAGRPLLQQVTQDTEQGVGKTEGKEAKGDEVAGRGGNLTTMSDLYTDEWRIEQTWAAGWEREEG